MRRATFSSFFLQMNRRSFLKTTGISLVATNVSSAVNAQESPTPSADDDFKLLSAPVLVNVSATKVTVLIAVSSFATGLVDFGETRTLEHRASSPIDGMHPAHHRFLRFEVEGLKPGTRYFYRLQIFPVTFHNAYRINRGTPVFT